MIDIKRLQDGLDVGYSLWVLGVLGIEDMPLVAANALTEGYDSASLRILAGLESVESYRAASLFERALSELGQPSRTKRQAALQMARTIAGQILLGGIDALDGAEAIAEVALLVGDPDFHDLDPFTYISSEIQERPEERQFFEEATRTEALRLIDQTAMAADASPQQDGI